MIVEINVCAYEMQCPTTIVPFCGDQFLWGAIMYQKGVGPAPIPISNLSVDSLSQAIRFMLQPQVCMLISVKKVKQTLCIWKQTC